jgi:general secretion pathway protein B
VVKALPTAPQAAPASKAKAATQPDTVAPPADKPSASPTATVPVPVPLLSELPEAMRSQIPALTVTGTVYSDNPALRLLLVNNQVLPQGSTVAAGVTLEEIRPRSSTFSFRGTRFRIAH